MIELLINNQHVDITDDVEITLNATNTDFSNPTAVKNAYSKTISLPGTKTNNKVFSDLYRLDATNEFNFDTSLRNEAVILNNGSLVDSGYVTLDKITVTQNIYKYDITFYSMLGQFFYNLKYSEEENGEDNEKTLSDLYYGFEVNGKVLTPEEEDNRILLQWNSYYIHRSWNELFGANSYFKNYSNTTTLSNVTAAPMYTGYNEDFDSDKILINKPSDTLKQKIGVPTDRWNTSLSYTKNWVLTEMPRELDQWEVGSLRSLDMRPAIRNKIILDAISKPENNGGFNVEWPDGIKATDGKLPKTTLSNYYNLTWMIKDKFNFEEYTAVDEQELGLYNMQLKDNAYSMVTFNSNITADTSYFVNPKAQIALNINLPYNAAVESRLKPALCMHYGHSFTGAYYEQHEVFNTSLIEFDVTYGDKTSKFFICDDYPRNSDVEGYRQKYFPDLPEGYFNNSKFIKVEWLQNKTVKRYINRNKLFLELNDLPITDELYMSIEQKIIHSYVDWSQGMVWESHIDSLIKCILVDNYEHPNNYEFYHLTQGRDQYSFNTITMFDNNVSENYVSILYDTTQTYIQNVNIDKKILFQNSMSPLDYLLTFCKMLNLKFLYEHNTNTIKIVESINYYTGEVIDISDKIDRSKQIDIVPNFWDSKIYKYQLPSNETYIEKIANKKSKQEYGALYYNTQNQNLTGTTDVCEDWCFNTFGDFTMSSVYFENYMGKVTNSGSSIVPQEGSAILKGNNITLKLFKDYEFASDDVERNWNKYTRYADPISKICQFSDDNESVDSSNLFAFLNTCIYFTNPGQGVCVYDNLPIMFELNETPCHIEHYGTANYSNTSGYNSVYADYETTLYYVERYVPYFSPYMFATTQSASGKWNLSTGRIIYNGNKLVTEAHGLISTQFIAPTYNANKNIVIDETKYLFDWAWKNNYIDWFDKNNKMVELSVFLDPTKTLNEMMQDFYYFDNAIWLLNEVKDLHIGKTAPSKCSFIKVKDIDNYKTRWSPEVKDT